MKALVFHKINDVRVDTVDDPSIEDSRDAIIRVTSTAICGSDLHILDGFVPQMNNMVLGHEFMGIVEEVGSGVGNLKKGDRVVVPFPIACGSCFFCTHKWPTQCENSNKNYGPDGGLMTEKGAALFGYTDLYGGIQGGQAEYVRVPYADFGPRIVPDELTDEQVLFLTDIFPTGWAAADWGRIKGGETVAIFGAGPVGIMAAKSAWIMGAGRVVNIDVQQYRLEMAKKAANSETILWESEDQVVEIIRGMTEGRGADVCIDAVGMEADRSLLEKAKAVINFEKGTTKVLETCMRAVRRAGVVSVVGVYGAPYDNFPLGRWFDKGITLMGTQAPVQIYIDHLMNLVQTGQVTLNDIITHTLPLSEAPHGYDIFKKKEDNCVKVVLKP
ncbi:glutathione-dependent formaldehyde dehydrogenase (plasmid) [Adhaeribacter swui]|uniref:Glutathione-dependent formaldehyde dehydrogenase n=1 Tax=Adhaeribacter swui TaxID=2086471 RepID=A0A7G7G253_9BACT|nr:zinc-dependent alcohol dehydrogenase [Adhaeribacter swui]QNF31237.1 glutathione-dependent formaldehyde dehydrogenase [Adhaeribacter swui]